MPSSIVEPTLFKKPTLGSIIPVCLLLACTGLSSLASGQASAPAIPSTFFAMTILEGNDFPPLTIGKLGHPAQLLWPFIEKQRGSYDFSYMDQYVQAAANHDIPITLCFGKVPIWQMRDAGTCLNVGGGMKSCPGPPKSLDEWRQFVSAIANHYKGRVQYYELWNEANLSNTFTGSAADLLSLAKIAYPLIKSIDPNAIVLTPSIADYPPLETAPWDRFLGDYLHGGGDQYADGGNFHGYTGGKDPEAIVDNTNSIRQFFDSNGLKGLPIYDTEGGWGKLLPEGADNQAGFIARWYLLQAGLFATDNLREASWFAWGGARSNDWGKIENSDGTPTQAGLAFNQVYKWLVGASLPRPCSYTGSDRRHAVWTCNLSRPSGYEAQAVWNTASLSSYKVPAGYTRYRDLAGNTVSISGDSVMIGPKPVLLEKGTVSH